MGYHTFGIILNVSYDGLTFSIAQLDIQFTLILRGYTKFLDIAS